MKRFILYTLVAFTLLSCGGSEGRFRLKGEFEHLRRVNSIYIAMMEEPQDSIPSRLKMDSSTMKRT